VSDSGKEKKDGGELKMATKKAPKKKAAKKKKK